MFYLFCKIFATNLRMLTLESPKGYVVGSVGSHAQINDNFLLGDVFAYFESDEENVYYIRVDSKDIYLKIDKDNSLVYEYTTEPNEDNKFGVMRDLNENYTFFLHDNMCVTYNEKVQRFYLKPCDRHNVLQRFIPRNPQTGEVLVDYMPIKDLGLNKLFAE